MIKPEFYKTREDGVDLYISKSKNNKYIRQLETGIEYEEAIDVADENGNIRYTYEETDKYFEDANTPNETQLKAQAYDILIGEVE